MELRLHSSNSSKPACFDISIRNKNFDYRQRIVTKTNKKFHVIPKIINCL